MADAKMAVSVLLNARDQLTGTIKKARTGTGRLGDAVRRVGRSDGFQRLRRSIGRASDATRRLVGRIGKIGAIGAAGATAAVAAVGRMTAAFANSADSAVKLADQVGISVETLQEYRFAAERMGVSSQKVDASLAVLSKRVGEAKNGTGALVTQLKKSNPELLEQLTNTRNAGEAMELYLRAIEQAPDANAKAALASAGFSRANQDMVRITRDGIDNITALRNRAQELGLVISEQTARQAETFNDRLTDLKGSLAGVKNILGSQLLPVFTSVFEQATTWVVRNQQAVREWAEQFAADLPGRLETMRARFDEVVASVRAFIDRARPVADIALSIADQFGRVNVAVGLAAGVLAAPILAPLTTLTAALVSLGTTLVPLAVSAIPAVTSAIGFLGTAIVANPIGATITAIAGAALLIYRYWGPISAFAQRVWDTISDTVAGAYEAISGWLGFDPLAVIRPLWDGLAGYVGGVMDALGRVASGGIGSLGDLLGALNPLGAIRPAFDAARRWLAGVDWSAAGQALLATVTSGLAAAGRGVVRTMQGVVRGAYDWLVGVDWSEAGRKLLGTFVAGIKSAASTVKDAVTGALGKARNLLPFSDAREGPLSDLTKSGARLPSTFAAGVEANRGALIGAVNRVMSAANDQINAAGGVVVPMRSPSAPRGESEAPRSDGGGPASQRNSAPVRASAANTLSRPAATGGRRRPVRVDVNAPISIQMGNSASAQDVGNAVRESLANEALWSGVQDLPGEDY